MASVNQTLQSAVIARSVQNLDTLEVSDSSDNVLVTYTVMWSADEAGVQEVQSVPIAGTAVAAGDAAKARLYNSTGSPDEQISGLTVGTSGTDVTIDNVVITNGQTVNLTSLTLTFPAPLQ